MSTAPTVCWSPGTNRGRSPVVQDYLRWLATSRRVRLDDWIRFTERGSCVITGRSDATLNRGGVRLGTGEFYSVLDGLDEISDSLVVHLEDPEGGPGELLLFVVPAAGVTFDDSVRGRIGSALRRALSPRHVRDAIQPAVQSCSR
jgi:acetoacetyl-CoA synthetase